MSIIIVIIIVFVFVVVVVVVVAVQITTKLKCLNFQSLSITFSQGILRAERTDTIALDRQVCSDGSLETP